MNDITKETINIENINETIDIENKGNINETIDIENEDDIVEAEIINECNNGICKIKINGIILNIKDCVQIGNNKITGIIIGDMFDNKDIKFKYK